ncbi:MAG: aminopeptidase N [Nocardioides marinisabuli]|uniref:aminopeptidase N n=1 Tax=Nocardioides marinisabuli TaxID=419476 RepID=UPI00321C0B23
MTHQHPATAARGLQRSEALARAELLEVTSYDVTLDLASSEETFDSTTRLDFVSRGGRTFLDLKPRAVRSIRLNGRPVDVDLLQRGRVPLETVEGPNQLVVEAVMAFRNDGEGLHRSVDPADGRHYVYGMSFMDAAPSIFACFDQPDLKAPYTFHVRAPEDWVVVGNAPGTNPEPGVWELETSKPLSTYFVTLVAGPYHLVRDEHDGIPLGLSCRQSIAAELEADADELLTLTRQCFDELHRLFGIRYPFGDYHQAFVPEFNAGAMENPGCVTFRDPLVFTSKVTRGQRIQRASTVAHEMAHQWFGNITTPLWWDDLWLNESFAEYMGNRVTADVTEYDDAWVQNAYARRQWGLLADQRPSTHPVAGNGEDDATAALQNFDGISYAKGSSILKQLNATMGDEVFLAGVRDHLQGHFYGNATMHDLLASWTRAGAVDLGAFADNWLVTAGPDRIVLDRGAGRLLRTPPTGHPADRAHTLRVATRSPGDAGWQVDELVVDAAETSYDAPAGAAVLLDPFEDTWAVTEPDAVTTALLPGLVASTGDPLLRAGMWNSVRSAYHHAHVAPEAVLDLLEAWLPAEDQDAALQYTLGWVLAKVVPLAADPGTAAARVHTASLAAAQAAEPGSTLQLAAYQAAVSSSASTDLLEGWLMGRDLPAGVELDLALRWRVLVRLAVLGAVDRDDLGAHLEAEPTAVSRVEHTRAIASMPTAEAKAWAWERFTGETTAPNYELEAAGEGMWRAGQDELLAPYVARYFDELPGTAEVHSGWVLADVAEAFFPLTSLDDATLERARALIARPDLDSSLRRRVVDTTDELEHRLAVRRAFAGQ